MLMKLDAVNIQKSLRSKRILAHQMCSTISSEKAPMNTDRPNWPQLWTWVISVVSLFLSATLYKSDRHYHNTNSSPFHMKLSNSKSSTSIAFRDMKLCVQFQLLQVRKTTMEPNLDWHSVNGVVVLWTSATNFLIWNTIDGKLTKKHKEGGWISILNGEM